MLLIVRQPDLGTPWCLLASPHDAHPRRHGVEICHRAFAVACWPSLRCSTSSPGAGARSHLPQPDADPQGAVSTSHVVDRCRHRGLTGRGYMEACKTLLPARSITDFIFANIAEELGFLAPSHCSCSSCLRRLGMRAAFRSRDPFLRLVSFGITATILLQAFFNISVVLSMVPTKGIRFP